MSRAKYDPQNRRERNTATVAARMRNQYIELGADPRFVPTSQKLKALGRNLKNRAKVKQVGKQSRWISASTKQAAEQRRMREQSRSGRFRIY
jgi:hypothetical protein